MAPPETIVTFESEPTRTKMQNAKMWVLLAEVAKQATLRGKKKPKERWKLIMLQALGHEIEYEEGLEEGQFFPVGHQSSQLSKDHMSQLIEFIYYFGAENGVTFNDPS